MMKKCSKCGEEKPLTTEFFHRGKDTKEGFKSACKVCRAAEKKTWRDANKDRINRQAKEYHIKNREQRLEYSKEYHQKNREHRLAYSREYYQNNKETIQARIKEWVKRNPEKVKEKSRRFAENNPEKLIEYQQRYRENNKEKIRLRDIMRRRKPEVKEYYRQYRLRPEVKESKREYKRTEQGKQTNKRSKHKRRAMEKETLATLSLEQWNECLDHFKHSCAYCGTSDQKLSQDHFVPVSKGGEFTVKNILPACGSCNSSKGDRYFFEWYPNQRNYSLKREKKIVKYLDIKDNTQQIAMF